MILQLEYMKLYESWTGECEVSATPSVKVGNASRNEIVSTLVQGLLLLIWCLQCLMQ